MQEKVADNERFIKLHIPNQGRIYLYILSRVNNWNDAEDIFQETSAVMWRKFETFEPGTDFAAWGMKIAHNKIMEYFRTKGRSCVRFNDEIIKTIESKLQTRKTANEPDNLKALEKCVKKLSERDRHFISMRYTHSKSVSQIADRVGISVRAIYKNLSRIHNSLLRCVRMNLATEDLT